MSTPTKRQLMLSFAYMAYCGEDITTLNPEKTILGYINAAMPKIPPVAAPNAIWKVVWEPATYTVPGALYQDNMMYVVQNQSDKTQFAIAIRGTNSKSQLDWLLEDFDVMQMMNWPPGAAVSNPPGAMISESTSIDLQVLLAMQGRITVSKRTQKLSLMKFLNTQTSAAINICVTGHSLGGCVAGTLALYLKENKDAWDRSGKSVVSCVTFAAPTAGNVVFANYSDLRLKGNCDAVRCNYDVAPQAWIASNLSSNASSPLFKTYGSNLDFAAGLGWEAGVAWTYILQNLFPSIAAYLTSQNYQQIQRTAPQLPGTYNNSFKPASDSLLDYVESFRAQAEWQHGNSYPTILGVSQLLNSNIIKLS